MSDPLYKSLEQLFLENEKRFDAPIKESYDEFDVKKDDGYGNKVPASKLNQDEDDAEDVGSPEDHDVEIAGSEESEEPKKKDKIELPPETHESVFPQPAASKGILFLNPKAIPNDYGKGHVVMVLKVDKADKKVRVDSLKNGKVHVPFSIIKKDEAGREYVTKEDIKKAFKSGNFVYNLLKLQPATLARHTKVDKLGVAGPDNKRVQAINPNVQEPSGEVKGDAKAQDALRRGVAHRAAGTRGDGETPAEFQQAYGKDLDTGVKSADLARKSGLPKPGTPEWAAHIAKLKAEKK